MIAIDRPELKFGLFQTGIASSRGVALEGQRFFGADNWDLFRAAGKNGSHIPAETRLRVDREIYAKVGQMFMLAGEMRDWRRFYKDAMQASVSTHNYARAIFFADQDKQGTLTTNIAVDDHRPSKALERLTAPTSSVGLQLKYEQGRQLGLALLAAEVISRSENGNARAVLAAVNDFLEERFFVGKKGDPQPYHIYSYHWPRTNALLGVSPTYPDADIDPSDSQLSWVKSLNYPVRTLGIVDQGKSLEVPISYDPREKDVESAVIKAKERSLRTAVQELNGDGTNGLIETEKYAKDHLGFRLVVMEEGDSLRDAVVADLSELFKTFEGYQGIAGRDNERLGYRRRYISIEGLKNPLEMIVYSLRDWIDSEYHVGSFDPELGMHDGLAHDLYKLWMVGQIAEYLWPREVFGIDLDAVKKASSYDFAARLRRKQRIHPSPYLEE